MSARRAYRDRDETEVEILDALVNRAEEGMTVFELRAAVTVEIDEIEDALARLKADGLIVVDANGETVIKPADRVVPENPDENGASIGEWLRERMPF